jgi:hypothetical protein
MLMTYATLGVNTCPGGVSGSGVDLVRVRDRAAIVLQYFNAAIAGLSNHVKVSVLLIHIACKSLCPAVFVDALFRRSRILRELCLCAWMSGVAHSGEPVRAGPGTARGWGCSIRSGKLCDCSLTSTVALVCAAVWFW